MKQKHGTNKSSGRITDSSLRKLSRKKLKHTRVNVFWSFMLNQVRQGILSFDALMRQALASLSGGADGAACSNGKGAGGGIAAKEYNCNSPPAQTVALQPVCASTDMPAPAMRKRLLIFTFPYMILGALSACGGHEEPEPPPTPPPAPQRYPDTLPVLKINPETELGKNDGSIQNLNTQWTVEISTSPDFSSGNFTLAPNVTSSSLSPGNYYARWAATGTYPASSKVLDVTIEKGKEPPLDIESIEPYIEGSNQEWALSSLAQLPNSAEMIRYYNYLLRAHTYLMLHDQKNYRPEYDETKKIWDDYLANPPPDLAPADRERLKQTLDDENWTIQCEYPLKKLFKTHIQVTNATFLFLQR